MAKTVGPRMQHEVGADFGAYAKLAGWTAVLEVAEAQTAPISMVGASPDAVRLGKIIFAVLLTKTEGKAFSIVHLTPRGTGAEARRLLHTEYAGSSGGRLGKMVRDVVCPREHWLARCECWQRLPDVTDRVGKSRWLRTKWPVVTESAKQCGWQRSWITHQTQ